jgi:ornithine carbamoyltransferase
MEKNILSGGEFSRNELEELVGLSVSIKKNPEKYRDALRNKKLFLLFQKTSTRTRAAFELGMKALGGDTVVMDWEKSNFSISPIRYEAAFVSRIFDCVLARLVKNPDMRELGGALSIPTINGCCNLYHPSQALADYMTIYETEGGFDTSLCYVGVHNNVANSLALIGAKLGVRLVYVTPLKDTIPDDVRSCISMMRTMPADTGNTAGNKNHIPMGFEENNDLEYAVSQCKYIYTDTWVNMELFNDEKHRSEKEERIEKMLPYQINRGLIRDKNVYIMHDMPVHPGFEIDDYSINCDRSLILQQAENRLYTAQALLLLLLSS